MGAQVCFKIPWQCYSECQSAWPLNIAPEDKRSCPGVFCEIRLDSAPTAGGRAPSISPHPSAGSHYSRVSKPGPACKRPTLATLHVLSGHASIGTRALREPHTDQFHTEMTSAPRSPLHCGPPRVTSRLVDSKSYKRFALRCALSRPVQVGRSLLGNAFSQILVSRDERAPICRRRVENEWAVV